MNSAYLALPVDDLLRKAAAAQRYRLERALRPFGLSSAQYFCVRELEKRPRQTNAELSRACDLSPQTMIVVVANLEKRDLVKRARDSEKLRVFRLELTRKGEEIAGICQTSVEGAVMKPLRFEGSDSEVRAMVAFLRHVARFGE